MQVANLVERNRSKVEAIRFPSGRDRPWEARIEEDVRLDDLAAHDVEREGRRTQDAVEIGAIHEPQNADAVVVERARGREARELRRQRDALDGLPGRERGRDRLL